MRLSAWRLRAEQLALPDGLGEPDPPPPPPDSGRSSLPEFWTEPVAYHAALDWRFTHGEFDEPGAAACWTRLKVPLVRGEAASPLERLLVMADAASGISHVLDWQKWVFINVELGIHLERPPEGEWMAMDATTRLGPAGAGRVHERAVGRARSRRRVDADFTCGRAEVESTRTVTLTGWIFMVGLRVFDIGALIVWLVWFFKLRDDEDDEGGGGPGGGGGGGPDGGPPLPDAGPWPRRRRDHLGDLSPALLTKSTRFARFGGWPGSPQTPPSTPRRRTQPAPPSRRTHTSSRSTRARTATAHRTR